ncbi:HlyD family secretion protein [Bradyrhizobium brasilense]|uniref:efflux RND transporter periplasmic adaptor subunit n=1 Tax=Bradyrhizobium brasilense TaxID=1419277 RepID=UPI0014568AC1|nr:HlyD family secretion protein [Bradyrhizobium brasilense]NLS69585.1 HlyD family secretion protein [Bradyrhizobium brasilense]
MDAVVHDVTVREIQANAALPSATEESVRRVSLVDQPALRVSEGRTDDGPTAPAPVKSTPPLRNDGSRAGRLLVRKLATVGIAAMAVLAALVSWDQYNAGPWTRDGRLRVQVASVAPEISGRIKGLRVVDNQFVHKGDVLYVVDPFDFEVALRTNKAALQQKVADLSVKALQSERRSRLSDLAASTEQKQVYEGNALQAKAAVESAEQQVAQAEINLERTEVRSPVNGIVTNLLLREGDYAHLGAANVSIIDTDSYWVDGYFEETKLARLCVGDRAEAKLMGYSAPITGHIATVTRGVSVSNAAAATQGLPNVDPVYTWVRLAQRVPVRIAIDHVPAGVPLVSGLTATVTIRDGTDGESATLLQRVRAELETSFFGLIGRASARPGCIPNPA